MRGRGDNEAIFTETLARILRDNDLNEIEVSRINGEFNRISVRVSRNQESAQRRPADTAPPERVVPLEQVSSEAAAEPEIDDPSQMPGVVTSPMVGTVYLQPEPGAETYVQIGQVVSEGETLLLIEAMKTMNLIPSPHAGTVTRILVEDGTPVEFGAPLMVVARDLA